MFFCSSDVYKSNKLIDNFQQLLDNLFAPLFEVTNNPSSHPELHAFLQYVRRRIKCTVNCKYISDWIYWCAVADNYVDECIWLVCELFIHNMFLGIYNFVILFLVF